MKTLKVTKIENGYYLNEIVENGETIARYVTPKECECMSVDGSFAFFADKSNADRLEDYKAYRGRAEERAEMDELSYNMQVADIFAKEVANSIKVFAKNESVENFGLRMMNEIRTFLATYPVEGERKKSKIEEIQKDGRKALEGAELVYRDEPGVTGEQENR